MIEDAQLGFYVGDNIANASAADVPKWNPGDEFEAARKAAQAQLTDSGGQN